jgi:hydroxymethylpyrimidine/phosphomethylpyrimidine kinase
VIGNGPAGAERSATEIKQASEDLKARPFSSPTRRRAVALTVAGSDNSSGAGVQADLKTFSYFGCYGLTAVTCVVAEVPGKVSAIQPVRTEIIAEQIALSFTAFPVAAAKTGMLYSASIVKTVAEIFAAQKTKLVVDPVMVASSGDPLLKRSAIAAYETMLFPHAALITPNLDELRILSGCEIRNVQDMRNAGKLLVEKFGCAFLVKGGHLRRETALDLLITAEGVEEFAAPFFSGVDTHGTGCTYSAAIAANLAQGSSLSEAVSAAKAYVTTAIKQALQWQKTHALEHFPAAAPN